MHQDLSSNNFTNECSRFKAIFSFLKLAWIRLNRPDQIGDALNHSTARRARNTLTSYRLLLPLLPPPLLLLPPIRPPLVGNSEPLLPPPLLLLPPIRPPLVGNSQPVFTMAPPDHRTGNISNPLQPPALLPSAPATPPAWPLPMPPDHRMPTHLPPLLPQPLRRASLLRAHLLVRLDRKIVADATFL